MFWGTQSSRRCPGTRSHSRVEFLEKGSSIWRDIATVLNEPSDDVFLVAILLVRIRYLFWWIETNSSPFQTPLDGPLQNPW